MSGITTVEFVFLLLLFFIVVFGILARKLSTPYPIIMVVGGLLLSFVPAVPDITLAPDLIFPIVLPPLLHFYPSMPDDAQTCPARPPTVERYRLRVGYNRRSLSSR
jgi:hypothetical protein